MKDGQEMGLFLFIPIYIYFYLFLYIYIYIKRMQKHSEHLRLLLFLLHLFSAFSRLLISGVSSIYIPQTLHVNSCVVLGKSLMPCGKKVSGLG